MKNFYLITALCAVGLLPAKGFAADLQAGNYLASRFAQSNHDWSNANKFTNKLLNADITPDNILQRSMILSMGAGNTDAAIRLAKRVKEQNSGDPNAILEIFLIAEAFKKANYEQANSLINSMPDDATSKFVEPFVRGWLDAAQGKLNIANLVNSTAQLYHGILISDFLDDYTEIEKIIDKSLKIDNPNIGELERIADLYGHVGVKDKALKLYKIVLKEIPEYESVQDKIANLEQGKTKLLFNKITTANNGMAKAFHDIATILNNEQNDESARVFANIALYLDPDINSSKFLLANISVKHKQYKAAIDYYNSISRSDEEYINAQYEIIDIYEDTKRHDKALALLEALPQNTDTLIKIGDIHRGQGNFGLALKAYDKAIEKLGGTIPKNYWHLHYVRGIAYEQLDKWSYAEKELKAALSFQPDHPYILNYLGYAWADQGVNLEESLAMIKKAVKLRPSDGYITDSLGWVMYRTQDYKNAVSVLEQAALLLPYDPTVNDHLGDAYWKVGRKLEAKFQWRRAVNNSKDSKQIEEIKSKLVSGILK